MTTFGIWVRRGPGGPGCGCGYLADGNGLQLSPWQREALRFPTLEAALHELNRRGIGIVRAMDHEVSAFVCELPDSIDAPEGMPVPVARPAAASSLRDELLAHPVSYFNERYPGLVPLLKSAALCGLPSREILSAEMPIVFLEAIAFSTNQARDRALRALEALSAENVKASDAWRITQDPNAVYELLSIRTGLMDMMEAFDNPIGRVVLAQAMARELA